MADIIVVKQNVAEKVAVNPAPVTITGQTLVPATNATLGGIIVGDNLTITGNGVLSAQPGGGGGAAALSGLTDVLLTSPASGDLIAYNQSNLKWINIKQSTVTDGGNF